MNSKKLLTIIMAIMLMLALLPTTAMAENDPLALPSSPAGTLSISVDTIPLTLTYYRVVYVANPVAVKSGTSVTYDYETMNIYVPSLDAQ
jgi:hypothetical protein